MEWALSTPFALGTQPRKYTPTRGEQLLIWCSVACTYCVKRVRNAVSRALTCEKRVRDTRECRLKSPPLCTLNPLFAWHPAKGTPNQGRAGKLPSPWALVTDNKASTPLPPPPTPLVWALFALGTQYPAKGTPTPMEWALSTPFPLWTHTKK